MRAATAAMAIMISDGDDRRSRARVQEADVAQERGREVAGEGADHEDVAMREVDHAQDAVDHRVAQRDEGIDTAQRCAVHEKVDPGIDGVLARRDREVRAHHDDEDDDDPEAPQERRDGDIEGSLRRLGAGSRAVVSGHSLSGHAVAVSLLVAPTATPSDARMRARPVARAGMFVRSYPTGPVGVNSRHKTTSRA